MDVLDAIRLLLVIVSALFTALPFLSTGFWVVRFCDFPRHLVTAAASLAAIWSFSLPGYFDFGVGVFATAIALWQGSHVIKYTPFYRPEIKRVRTNVDANSISLGVANLQFENQQKEVAEQLLQELDVDILLLIEMNAEWSSQLENLRQQYPYRIEEIREEGLGLSLWSRKRLHNAKVKYLVADDRPSIHTEIDLGDGQRLHFIGLHPTPPGLYREDREERADSRIRDAELIIVAKQVAKQSSKNWIVTGDFNDVAWSHTTRLFKRISGLKDPRVGRGLFNTYHARKPFLRFPIDHIFVSASAGLVDMRTFHPPGSDHKGIYSSMQFAKHAPEDEPEKISSDEADADQLIQEGLRDAAIA